MDKFTSFVLEHENDDPADLVLRKGRWPDIDVELAAATIAGRRKMRTKAPSWYACPEIIYPSRLCVEQSSGEEACAVKAEIIRGLLDGGMATVFGNAEADIGGKVEMSGVGPADKSVGLRIADLTGEGDPMEVNESVGLRIADITGGLGVDSSAFAKFCDKVLYVERSEELCKAARHNFPILGRGNIKVLNAEVTPNGLGSGGWDVLQEFGPDIIYLDPSRRSDAGDKVFKLEDCRPDILQLKDVLLDLAPTVIVKLSPMADIDMVVKQIGPQCRRIDVISIGGECKELLVTLIRENRGGSEIPLCPDKNGKVLTCEDRCNRISDDESGSRTMAQGWCGEGECIIVADCGRANSFAFHRHEEAAAVPALLQSPAVPTIPGGPTIRDSSFDLADPSGKILLEPDKALMKAGPFKLLSSRLGLTKLDTSTHYYIFNGPTPNEGLKSRTGVGTVNEETMEGDSFQNGNRHSFSNIYKDLFRAFKILRVEPLNKKTLKTIGREYPATDITARNIPLSTEELRKRLASAGPSLSGTGTIHIFGLRATGQNLLLVTEKLR